MSLFYYFPCLSNCAYHLKVLPLPPGRDRRARVLAAPVAQKVQTRETGKPGLRPGVGSGRGETKLSYIGIVVVVVRQT